MSIDGHDYEEEQREEIVREVLTDCPDDWICWVFDSVGDDERQKLILSIEEALAFYKPGEQWTPTSKALDVMEVLRDARGTLVQSDIENELTTKGKRLSVRTISPILNELAGKGLVHRPHGERKGVAITRAGREFLEQSRR